MDREQYLEAVERALRECTKTSDDGLVTGAYLASALRLQGLEWTRIGYRRLKDALADLAPRGVRMTQNASGAFAIAAAPDATQSVPGDATQGRDNAQFRPLLPSVWSAFVSQTLPRPRFIDRQSGEVHLGLRPDDDGRPYERVDEVSESEQRGWAAEFLKQNELFERYGALLEGDKWYRELPATLDEAAPNLKGNWNRLRSNRVIAHVYRWCDEHGVDRALLVQRKPQSRNDWSPLERTSSHLAQVIQRIISRMDTDELLQLRVPLGIAVSELRPDLLRRVSNGQ